MQALNSYLSRPQPATYFRQFSAKSLLVSFVAAAGLTACAAPIVTTAPSGCSSLIPPDWRNGVAGAPLPEGSTAADWIAFGDATVGKLDQANSRTKDAIDIQARCEARDAAAVKKATRGFFGRIFG